VPPATPRRDARRRLHPRWVGCSGLGGGRLALAPGGLTRCSMGWMDAVFQASQTAALAAVGSNLITFVFGELHFPLSQAANVVTNFVGTVFILSPLGGFLSDSYAGCFWTLLAFAAAELAVRTLPSFLFLFFFLPSLHHWWIGLDSTVSPTVECSPTPIQLLSYVASLSWTWTTTWTWTRDCQPAAFLSFLFFFLPAF